ncbi:MAG: 2-deoxy-D-gluconate 3-dehydrogenase [Betaproteobacteria bacterium RIFCSPHIGHO2_12_FULL_69_13]|nr:MAG: 2-deoxy-D-gluconate 3-dehydrogenase [Betaproteobacteria bacterium RIFCSPHIGHO2_12_FULL_69_13]OGA69290.1 MAG: 2-deoxy-D-gluconate 3-dehydrogenase [Betaproteobacteria bacterium RIFCSPLOWO2_12_FULL_68_20]
MDNPFDLSGKAAIVTGGNGGIGLGMAEGLARAGASLVVVGRNAAKNEAALARLAKLGARAIAVQADVARRDAWQRIVAAALGEFGRIDVLVNNAGISLRKAPQDFSLEEWRDILDTNLTAAFLGAQAVYPEFKRLGAGKIINTGSLCSILGGAFNVPYTASKGGILQLTRGLAVAWAKDNIQVNAVLPGWIETDLSKRARASIPGLDERVLARSPAGRWGRPEDHAGVAVFLASRASEFITGAAIPVDGGYSIQLL